MEKAAVWGMNGVRVQGTSWCSVFHLQGFDGIRRGIGLCRMLKLAVLLQTVQAWQVYGVSVAEGFLALAGQYGRFGCFELKMGKTLPFSPSVADSAVLGWENHSYLLHFFLSANNHLFVNEWSVARDKLMYFGFAKTGDWRWKEEAGEQPAVSS